MQMISICKMYNYRVAQLKANTILVSNNYLKNGDKNGNKPVWPQQYPVVEGTPLTLILVGSQT